MKIQTDRDNYTYVSQFFSSSSNCGLIYLGNLKNMKASTLAINKLSKHPDNFAAPFLSSSLIYRLHRLLRA